jgi:MFS transporter, YNFM family, putative membrane transport protein
MQRYKPRHFAGVNVSSAAPAAASDRALTRVIVLLALAAFASGASLRISDPLLPQVAQDFGASLGLAASIVTAYAIPYGTTQVFAGLIGDRLGKCQAVVLTCALSGLLVLLCAAAQSVPQLALARFVCAPGAAIIVPLGMAYVGDVVPYARRQTVLARFLVGQMFGMIAGQIAGGIIGDLFGWRMAFVALAGVFALAALALATQLRGNPWTKATHHESGARVGFVAGYRKLFAVPWARFIMLAVFIEAGIFFGGLTYVAADLHVRFGLSFSAVGLVVGCFGLGCLLYAGSVHRLVDALGERGLVIGGGILVMLGFLTLAWQPFWQTAPLACTLLGFGYYMVHNTLQTNATQMLPEARGTAVAGFSSGLFLGQSVGVALAAPIVDRAGAAPVFVLAALLWPALALWVRIRLARRGIF